MTEIQRTLRTATKDLQAHSATAGLDAELLLCHVLDVTRAYLKTYPEKPLTLSQTAAFRRLVQRRHHGEPVAYILGYQDFWTERFKVTPDVLIPRPETELLIELALQKLEHQSMPTILDLGTGSGIIACILAKSLPQAQVMAVDVAPEALAVAKENAQRLACETNIKFYTSSWFTALPQATVFDLIVSNPPYIDAADEHLTALKYEPCHALVAAEQGLADLFSVIAQARAYLKPQGWLLLEHGHDQAQSVAQRLKDYGYQKVACHTDLAGLPRATQGQWP